MAQNFARILEADGYAGTSCWAQWGTYYPIRVNWKTFSDRKLALMQWQHNMYTKMKRDNRMEAQLF